MDVERLKKLCGLLGSAHAGERAAAAEKATEALRAAGITWPELIAAAERGLALAEPEAATVGWREQVDVMIGHAWFVRLTEWERNFLRAIARCEGELSARQGAQLDRITNRFSRWADAA